MTRWRGRACRSWAFRCSGARASCPVGSRRRWPSCWRWRSGLICFCWMSRSRAWTRWLASHIIGDLERVCDYLVILSASHVQLAGDIQEIAKTHKRLIGPRQDEAAVASVHTVIETSHTERQTTLLVRAHGPLFAPSWEVQEVSMEDIVLAYLSQQAGDRWPMPPSVREQNGREVFK